MHLLSQSGKKFWLYNPNMYDLFNESRNIWLELKQGSLGTVLLSLKWDKKIMVSISGALQVIRDKHAVSEALSYPVWASLNCIGQLAYYQFVGDPSKPVYLDTKDPRWNPLRVMNQECLALLCESIANHSVFASQAEDLLSHLVDRIKSEQMRSQFDADSDPKASELQRQFLIHLGVATGHALSSDSKSLRGALGELVNLNSG